MTEKQEPYVIKSEPIETAAPPGAEEVRAVILVHQSGGTRYTDLVEALDAVFGCGRAQAEMVVDVLAEIGRRRRSREQLELRLEDAFPYDERPTSGYGVVRGNLAVARVSEGEAVRSLRATWHWLCGMREENAGSK